MAARKTAASFDDIIQADRLRRKNEALANDILGRGRKSNLASMENHKSNPKPTFASRVGIAKVSQRSSSSTFNKSNIEVAWAHDLRHARGTLVSRPSRRETQPARLAKRELFYDAVTDRSARNGSSNRDTTTGSGGEINIRGIAGPCVVVGTNFAPGTTAADIESAMIPSGGEMQSCNIVSYSPILVAEMVFAERANAENVIATFNNKKADGRVLHVYMKQEHTTPIIPSPNHSAANETRGPRANTTRSAPPPPELPHQETPRTESIRPETITPNPVRPDTYDFQREPSDRNRRRAEPEIQDGSYGFEPREEQIDVDMDDRRDSWRNDPRESDKPKNIARTRDDRRLYSDDLYPRHHGRVFRSDYVRSLDPAPNR